MRGVTKKILLSIFASIIVFLTTFATTYAWVGIFTYSSTDAFDMNIKVEDLDSDYFLTISPSGKINTFTEELPLIEIQKKIMDNLNVRYDSVDVNNANAIDKVFLDKVSLNPVSPYLDNNGNIYKFEEVINMATGIAQFRESNKYYCFDLYLSVDSKEGIQSTTNVAVSVALSEIGESISGVLSSYNLVNGNTILSNKNKPSNFDIGKYPILKDLSANVTVNSASSARFALEMYDPIEINTDYIGDETPFKTIIFQGGTYLPTLNDNVYSFGGILPEEYNFAIQEANKLYYENLKIPNEIKAREELELTGDNKIIFLASDYPDKYLGVNNGIQTKMKIKVYFWFEGWDADCLWAIDRKNVLLNLKLTADIDE